MCDRVWHSQKTWDMQILIHNTVWQLVLDGGYVKPGGYMGRVSTGRGPGPNLVTRPKPRPVSTPTRIYEAGFPKMEIWISSGIGGICRLTNYTVPTITIYKYIQKKKKIITSVLWLLHPTHCYATRRSWYFGCHQRISETDPKFLHSESRQYFWR